MLKMGMKWVNIPSKTSIINDCTTDVLRGAKYPHSGFLSNSEIFVRTNQIQLANLKIVVTIRITY